MSLPDPVIAEQVTLTLSCPYETCGWSIQFITSAQHAAARKRYETHTCLFSDLPLDSVSTDPVH